MNVRTGLHSPGPALAIDTPIPAAQAAEVIRAACPADRDRYHEGRLLATDPVHQLECLRAIVRKAGLPGADLIHDVADLAQVWLWVRERQEVSLTSAPPVVESS